VSLLFIFVYDRALGLLVEYYARRVLVHTVP